MEKIYPEQPIDRRWLYNKFPNKSKIYNKLRLYCYSKWRVTRFLVLVSSTDGSTDDSDAKAVISFGSPPPDNSVINYVVYSKINSFSKIELQEFTGDGSTADFTLVKTSYSAS